MNDNAFVTRARGLRKSEARRPDGVSGTLRSDSSVLFWSLDVLSVVAFVALELWGWAIVGNYRAPVGVMVLLVAASAVLSWALADVSSGVVHYVADHWGDERTPLLGRFLIAPFRRHHDDPQEMLRHGFFERNGNCALLALLVLFWIPMVDEMTGPLVMASMTCLFLGLWTLGTNQIHAWAHESTRPSWVSFLQRRRIILSPDHHGKHHAPFDHESKAARKAGDGSSLEISAASRLRPVGNYCITHGNCEPLLRLIVSCTLSFLGACGLTSRADSDPLNSSPTR